jgi:hypothetical protein
LEREVREEFQELKKRLMTTPVLRLPEKGKPYALYTDALNEGLGAVIIHDMKVITYASRKLKPMRLVIPCMIWNWHRSSLH